MRAMIVRFLRFLYRTYLIAATLLAVLWAETMIRVYTNVWPRLTPWWRVLAVGSMLGAPVVVWWFYTKARKSWHLFIIVLGTLLAPSVAYARPSIGVRVGEAYVLLVKDGASAGPTSTRFDVVMGVPLTPRLNLSFGIGTTMPNDILRPAPRASIGLSIKLTDKVGIGFGPGYQYNPAYAGKGDSHFIGFALIPSYRIGNVSLLFLTGPGWTSGINVWSWIFQPSIGYTF